MSASFIPPVDENKRPVYKMELAGPDMLYEPRAFNWTTAKNGSLYNRGPTGSGATPATVEGMDDIGDAAMKFYNSSGTELTQGDSETDEDFQTRLYANCTMTDVVWTPTYDRKCLGAVISCHNRPTSAAYFWAYVDLTSVGGGLIGYTPGGIPLHMMGEDYMLKIDGRVVPETALPSGIPLVFKVVHDILVEADHPSMLVFLEQFRA